VLGDLAGEFDDVGVDREVVGPELVAVGVEDLVELRSGDGPGLDQVPET
jgi:hypothetical protein